MAIFSTGFEKLSWSSQSWSEVMRRNMDLLDATYHKVSTLMDVDLTGLADGDILVYNSTSGKWEPQSPYNVVPITSLLIHSDATIDGDATFTDSGDYTHTITPAGSCVHSADTEKFCHTSIKFPGAITDYLSIPNHFSFTLESNSFTIDFWVRFSSVAGTQYFVCAGDTNGTNYYYISYSANNLIMGSKGAGVFSFSWTPVIDTWYHVAVCRYGNTILAFIDGTSIGSTAYTQDLGTPADDLHIGIEHYNAGYQNPLDGYIDEIQVLNGEALYKSNFTPPTAPYESYVCSPVDSLLIHSDASDGSTTFTDDSLYGHTISVNGSCEHSEDEQYFCISSIYFPGTTSDYLTVPNDTSFDLGSDEFVVDFWVRFDTVAGTQYFVTAGDTNTSNYWALYVNNTTNKLGFVANGITTIEEDWTPVIDTWYHVAISREVNNFRMFVDGSLLGTTAESGTISTPADDLHIGIEHYNAGYQNPLDGYIDEFRLRKEEAVYTTGFTPNAFPYNSYACSPVDSLLIHSDDDSGSTFIDYGNYTHTVNANGGVVHSTDEQKVCQGSIYFPGTTSDYLDVAKHNSLNLLNLDFTIDFWLMMSNASGNISLISCGDYADNGGWILYKTSEDLRFGYYTSGNPTVTDILDESWELSVGVWYHIACTRQGNSWRLFVDGTQLGSTTTDSTLLPADSTNGLYIGAQLYNGSVSNPLFGYMDEIRIHRGTAYFVTNFTPTIVPYDGYTCDPVDSLVIHSDTYWYDTGHFYDDSIYGHTVTPYGSVYHSTYEKKLCESSIYFSNSTGKYLRVPSDTSFDFQGEDFTIDFWYLMYDTAGTQTVFTYGDTINANRHYWFYASSATLYAKFDSVTISRSWTPVVDTWYHIAITRDGNDWRMFLDGTQLGATVSNSTTLLTPLSDLRIGVQYNNGSQYNPLRGYLDEFRMRKGEAIWNSNFTPPSSPHNWYSCLEPSLMIHSDAADGSTTFTDSIGTHTVNVNGSVEHSDDKPYFCRSSIYFPGTTSDYLYISDHNDFNFGDMTLDLWIRFDTSTTNQTIISQYQDASNYWRLATDATNLYFQIHSGGSDDLNLTYGVGGLSINTWYHIAVTRSGSTWRLYTGGTQRDSDTFVGTFTNYTGNIQIGVHNSSNAFSGYMDEIRLYSRHARYVSNFTPPIFPCNYDCSAYDALLIHSDTTDGSTTFIDSGNNNPLTGYNSARHETDYHRYCQSSLYFPGTAWIESPMHPSFVLEGDFTIDLWVRFPTVRNSVFICSGDAHPDYKGSWWLQYNHSGPDLRLTVDDGMGGDVKIYRSWTPSANIWYHIALTRDDGTLRLFVDGTQLGGTETDNKVYMANEDDFYLARYRYNNGFSGDYQSYMDEVRIRKGEAVWTSNFTPPSAPYDYSCLTSTTTTTTSTTTTTTSTTTSTTTTTTSTTTTTTTTT